MSALGTAETLVDCTLVMAGEVIGLTVTKGGGSTEHADWMTEVTTLANWC